MSSSTIVLPDGVEHLPAIISGISDKTTTGKITIKKWSDSERKSRAFKKTFKIVGTIFACSLIGLFVHILLVIIIPTLIITLLATVPLYLKNIRESVSFFYVDGECPSCGKFGQLKPYVSTQLTELVTVQCSDCGETSKVRLSS